MTRRFEALDGLRALAAGLVVLFHLRAAPLFASLTFLQNAYAMVDLFFMLSGFLIHSAYRDRLGSLQDVRQFLMRRFLRLYPLYIALLASFTLIPTNPARNWNPPAWSLSAEFVACIIYAVVMRCGLLRAKMSCVTTLGLGLLAYSTMGILHGTLDLTDGFGLVRSVSGFLIGASLYQLTSSLPQLKSLQIFSGLASAATLIFARNEWINLALICFAVLIVSLQTDAGAVAKFLRTKIMQHLGTISFSIYLAHYPLLRLFMSNADFNLQDLTVFFVVLWGLSLLTFRFVELPFQRLGRLLTPQWGDRA